MLIPLPPVVKNVLPTTVSWLPSISSRSQDWVHLFALIEAMLTYSNDARWKGDIARAVALRPPEQYLIQHLVLESQKGLLPLTHVPRPPGDINIIKAREEGKSTPCTNNIQRWESITSVKVSQ